MSVNGLVVNELNLNIDSLKKECYDIENSISNIELRGFFYPNNENSPLTTKKLHLYNAFLFPFENINRLYRSVSSCFRTLENNNDPFFIRGWINIYRQNEYLNWHRHGTFGHDNSYHGFFCVNSEGSVTDYRFDNNEHFTLNCKDNLLVIGKSGDNLHRTYPWDKQGDRITIAFDIHPLTNVYKLKETYFNININKYWIPI